MKSAVWGFLILLLLSLPPRCFAQSATPLFSTGVQERVILMRHAEKPEEKGDPNLTEAGDAPFTVVG